jgi:diguanylate cyclase (GGDEF)-like protein
MVLEGRDFGAMKVGRSTALRAPRTVGATAYARRVETTNGIAGAEPVTTATVLGIPENEFTPRVRDAIMTLMGEVENLRRELHQTRSRLEDVEKAADQDQLLPLLNRRAFVRELTRHIALANRYGTPSSLVYFDLDDFKTINDTHGHAGGDAVLAHFANTLLSHVRDSDVVGRLGGDEFGILLTHANQDRAHAKADQLAANLRQKPIVWDGKPVVVSFSYGAFELKGGENADAAMARADAAMYANKRAPK